MPGCPIHPAGQARRTVPSGQTPGEGGSCDDHHRPTEHRGAAPHVRGGRRQPGKGPRPALRRPHARQRPQVRASRGTACEGHERSPRRREEAARRDRVAHPAGGRIAERAAEDRAGRALDCGQGPRARAERVGQDVRAAGESTGRSVGARTPRIFDSSCTSSTRACRTSCACWPTTSAPVSCASRRSCAATRPTARRWRRSSPRWPCA